MKKKINPKIIIIQATYNGGQYLYKQLDSIVNQSYENWVLLISDDGSSDNTMEIINDYCVKDSRIRIVNKELILLGACQNFGNLLKTALLEDWDFVMFADQDDFWTENKIQLTLDSMLRGTDFVKLPKLVYTDFEYADELLNPLPSKTTKNTSVWKEPNLKRLLAENNVYGCTMMINRILAEKAIPIPLCAENHDYWIALVAALLGNIVHVKKRTMLYRQHSNNVSGHYSNNSIKARFRRYYKRNNSLEIIMRGRFAMAEMLFNRYEKAINEEDETLLNTYSTLENKVGIARVCFCITNGITKNNFVQNIAFYYSLLWM